MLNRVLPEEEEPGIEARNDTRWKSSLLWYFVTDLGLELNGQITLPKTLYRTARHHPKKTALLEKKSGEYRSTTFAELLEKAECFASALVDLGLQTGERVAILLRNSPEWVITDFGTMDAGGITVPMYFTLSPTSIAHLLQDSEARILLVEESSQLEKILPLWKDCPALKWVVLKEGNPETWKDPRLLSFETLMKRGKETWETHEAEITRRREAASYHDVATLIYTSGTTGLPKGVMLTHRNLLSNILSLLCVSGINENDLAVSVLPLSHAFERTVGYYLLLLVGGSIAYAESFEKFVKNFQEVHPTVCAAVPRMFEKIYERIQRKIHESGFLKRKLFYWALKVGEELTDYREKAMSLRHHDRRIRHRPEDRYNHVDVKIKNWPLKIKWWLARILVYAKFKKLLGGRLKYFVSGGAALRGEICQFFRNLDIYIYEGYGMTETSPVIAFNYRDKWKPGTVGKILPWIQIKLASDGEICVKGPSIMKGYFKNPEATAEVFDNEGWFHTGDIGVFDENLYLHITDRKKELIVMSNGKKVAPVALENLLDLSSFISQTMVIGNDRKYISALIIPNFPELKGWAKIHGLGGIEHEQLVEREEVLKLYEGIVAETNKKLSPFEQIKRFKLLPHEFTQEAGEVTPTLKIKRKVVEEKYGKWVEEMYLDFRVEKEAMVGT
jgi:long-chain acyl-CoA synthetase